MEPGAMRTAVQCLVALLTAGALIYVTAGPVSDDVTQLSPAHSEFNSAHREKRDATVSEVEETEEPVETAASVEEVVIEPVEPVEGETEEGVEEEEVTEEGIDELVNEEGELEEEEIEEEEDYLDEEDVEEEEDLMVLENSLDSESLLTAEEEEEEEDEDTDVMEEVTETTTSIPTTTSSVTEAQSDEDEAQTGKTTPSQKEKKRKRGNKRRKGKKNRKSKKSKKSRKSKKSKYTKPAVESRAMDLVNSTDYQADSPPFTGHIDNFMGWSGVDLNNVLSPIYRHLDTCQTRGDNCYEIMSEKENLCNYHEPALEMRKWANELEDVLSHGCCCRGKENCAENGKCCGSCCLRRSETFDHTVAQISMMLKELFSSIQSNCQCGTPTPIPIVTCTTWTLWSPCNKKCKQTRTRICPPGVMGNPEIKQSRKCDAEEITWSQWGAWSACSATCRPGATQTRVKTCERQKVGAECGRNKCGMLGRQKTETRPCVGLPPCNVPCVDAQWSSWGVWSSCPVSCGQGRVSRTRYCDTSLMNTCGRRECGGDRMESKMIDCGPPTGVGQWMTWSAWGQCSLDCGIGVRTRSRECSTMYSTACSQGCVGNAEEGEPCGEVPRDAEWMPWGQWSTCTKTCGEGVISRSRRCDNFLKNKCGRDCVGPAEETTVTRCGPVGQPSFWAEWSDWSPCSGSCGGGVKTRNRRCVRNPCDDGGSGCYGMAEDIQECDSVDPLPSEWASWGPWSECSSTCGMGTVRRSRRCNYSPCGGRCFGEDSQTEDRRCGPERVDAMWTIWSAWSQCPMTCGEHTVERTRRCDESRRTACGRTCEGGRTSDFKTVSCGPDNVPAVWESWTEWSDCPVTCGRGTVRRTRRCNSSPCGGTCRGDTTETKETQCGPYVDNGQWETWGSWSQCSSSCGLGRRERRRYCSNPFPNSCSRGCEGRTVDNEPCGEVYEPSNWSSWGQWSVCTRSCGKETIRRTRVCNSSPCGGQCYGREVDERLEQCGPEREVGVWESWGPWGGCDATCGYGTRRRLRQCSVARGDECRQGCYGREEDTERCGEPHRYAQWTPWGAWSACSATCGVGGTRTRIRTCDDSGPCTKPCPGVALEIDENCRSDTPCYNFQYQEWAKWCPCDCTTGNTTRQRHCMQVYPGGRTVRTNLANCHPLGNAREEEFCVNVPGVDECELCITSCSGKHDGRYQSCSDCSEYIICKDYKIHELKRCKTGTFSAFDGQCSLSSKSCGLVAPIKHCKVHAGIPKPNGKYPSEKGPNYYVHCINGKKHERRCGSSQGDRFQYLIQYPNIRRPATLELEYNHQLRACEMFTSPTCQRPVQQEGGRRGVMVRPVVDNFFLSDDSAAYDESDIEDNLTIIDDVDDNKMAELKEFMAGKEEKKIIPRRMNKDCLTSCTDVEDGDYGSCRGCDVKVTCEGGQLRETRCADQGEFDTKKQKCVKKSHTCKLRGAEGWLR